MSTDPARGELHGKRHLENFRVNLRERREELGLSQTDVARRMADSGHNFRQQTVQKIESGTRPVRLDEATDLSEVLASDLTDLMRAPLDRVRWEIQDSLWTAGLKAAEALKDFYEEQVEGSKRADISNVLADSESSELDDPLEFVEYLKWDKEDIHRVAMFQLHGLGWEELPALPVEESLPGGRVISELHHGHVLLRGLYERHEHLRPRREPDASAP